MVILFFGGGVAKNDIGHYFRKETTQYIAFNQLL